MKGTVKFFNHKKEFGFITGEEDKKDYFVHKTALSGSDSLDEGDSVEFDAEQGDKGPKAANVKKA